MRRTVATLGTAVLLTGLLTACSGEEPADPAESPSATGAGPTEPASESPSASPAPTVDKPERPAAMDQEDADGAAAAAVYFMEQWEYIMKSGDTTEWEAMSGNSCSTCDDGLKQAQAISENGYTYKGGDMTARVATRYEQDPATGIWPVDVQSTTGPIVIEDKEGEVVDKFEGESTGSRVEVGWGKDDDWVIVEIADIPKGA